MPSSGDLLGPYRLVRFLGRSAAGDTWLGAREDGLQVVLRIPSSAPPAEWTATIDRLAALRHPALVEILEHEAGERPYAVVEWVDGTSLDQVIERAARLSRWPAPGTAAHIARAVAEGLARLHAEGLAHGYVRPRTILLSRQGAVKLADLAVRAPSPSLYAAPERLVDPSADVFSLGLVLHTLLAERPFVEGAPPPAPTGAFAAIVAKATERDPARRYPHGAALAHALDEALEGDPDATRERVMYLVPRDSPTVVQHDTERTAAPTGTDRLRPEDRAEEPRFRLLERLGGGGMGEVFQAFDRELGEHVALKIIARAYAQDPEHQDRLRREVRLARRLRSDRVCRIHDLVELPDGARGVSMELLRGKTIGQLIHEGVPVDYKRYAAWAADIAEGLAAAHGLGIVHRDLKPDNVMITEDDRAVILDFGIARPHPSEAITDKLTREGLIVGTPQYMAPEQLTNQELDGRTDLYALGLILGELISGEVPLGAEDYHGLLDQRVIQKRRFHLDDLDPAAPAPLSQIVDRLLEPDRAHRFADARLVAASLRAFARGDPLPVDPDPEAIRPTMPASDPAPPPRDRSRLVLAALVAVSAGGLALVFWALERPPRPAPPPPAPVATSTVTAPAPPAPDAGATAPDAAPRSRPTAPRGPPTPEEM